jgi:hypothetical protein
MLHNLELAMAYGCPSGIDIPGFLWYAPCHSRCSDSRAAHCCGPWPFSLFFLFSALGYYTGGVCLTWHIFTDRRASPPRRAVGHAERELECRCHLDDLLPSSTDASAYARSTLPGDVKDVYEHRRNAYRVRCAIFRPWHRSRHHSRFEDIARPCVWICLDHVLR